MFEELPRTQQGAHLPGPCPGPPRNRAVEMTAWPLASGLGCQPFLQDTLGFTPAVIGLPAHRVSVQSSLNSSELALAQCTSPHGATLGRASPWAVDRVWGYCSRLKSLCNAFPIFFSERGEYLQGHRAFSFVDTNACVSYPVSSSENPEPRASVTSRRDPVLHFGYSLYFILRTFLLQCS